MASSVVPLLTRIGTNLLGCAIGFSVAYMLTASHLDAASRRSSWLHLSVSPMASFGGDTIVGGKVMLSAYADDGVTVAGVQFKEGRFNLGPELTSGSCSVTWDTTQTPDGAYMIAAVAHDTSGEVTASAPLLLRIQNTPPTITHVMIGQNASSLLVTIYTDEGTTSAVNYGPTAAYGTASTDAVLARVHRHVIEGLLPGTRYHFDIAVTNPVGISSMSRDYTLSTPGQSARTSSQQGQVAHR